MKLHIQSRRNDIDAIKGLAIIFAIMNFDILSSLLNGNATAADAFDGICHLPDNRIYFISAG